VQQFTQSAELVRKILPYMIDGVVISYINKNIINMLGRVNSVNKYQMAIKFNPRNVRTIFLGYTYNIGKSGEIIPMVHFKPAEFIGTIHTKQTIHSLQRFNELNLVKGQEIDVDYVNDVISYVTKPDTAHNRQLQSQFKPEPFIQICPYCGSRIEISDTGKSARCPNVHCHERKIMRMVDMISRLGFKDMQVSNVLSYWMNAFGTGTVLALEYFPSFSAMLTDCYMGGYLNNQITIEKITGPSMVKFTKTILQIGEQV
jgi:NAD-dependent DNA ligase